MIKTAGYPVIVDLDGNSVYSVYVDNELVFAGRSIGSSIDIAPLLRDYLNSERIIIDWPTGEGIENATPQLNAGIARIYKEVTDEEVKIYVVIDSMPTGLKATEAPVGLNLRGATIVFVDTDRPMTDLSMFEDSVSLWGHDPVYSNLRFQIWAVYNGGPDDESQISATISGRPETIIWHKNIGWLQTSFPFPDDRDCVIDGNTLRPAVGNSWGWNHAYIINAKPLTVDKVPVGFNLQGLTVRFLNQNLIPDGSFGVLQINNGTGGISQNDGVIQVGGSDITSAVIFMDGEWQLSEYTFSATKSCIVNANNLRAGTPGVWGWDSAIIVSKETPPMYVANDYNEDCKTNFAGEPYITSVFVRNEVDRRQIVFLGANSDRDSMILNINGVDTVVASPSVIVRATLGDADTLSFKVSDTEMRDSLDVKISPCALYRYALYAVNRRGGITHIICEGKPLESYQKSNWDIDTDYNRLSQVARGTRRMSVTSTRKWRLSTGYLTEDEARHVDDIVTSPRIVLHDLETGRLFAVNSTDGTIERRTRVSNGRKPIEYTLTFEEARTEIRR